MLGTVPVPLPEIVVELPAPALLDACPVPQIVLMYEPLDVIVPVDANGAPFDVPEQIVAPLGFVLNAYVPESVLANACGTPPDAVTSCEKLKTPGFSGPAAPVKAQAPLADAWAAEAPP